jgi:hypothetical protein
VTCHLHNIAADCYTHHFFLKWLVISMIYLWTVTAHHLLTSHFNKRWWAVTVTTISWRWQVTLRRDVVSCSSPQLYHTATAHHLFLKWLFTSMI